MLDDLIHNPSCLLDAGGHVVIKTTAETAKGSLFGFLAGGPVGASAGAEMGLTKGLTQSITDNVTHPPESCQAPIPHNPLEYGTIPPSGQSKIPAAPHFSDQTQHDPLEYGRIPPNDQSKIPAAPDFSDQPPNAHIPSVNSDSFTNPHAAALPPMPIEDTNNGSHIPMLPDPAQPSTVGPAANIPGFFTTDDSLKPPDYTDFGKWQGPDMNKF